MSGILWLASYPKSGNTWVRVLLANYWRNADAPVDVNGLGATPIASARDLFDELVGLPSADLLPDEIDALRCEAYAVLAREARTSPVLKIHDAYLSPAGRPIVPAHATRGAVYIVRNPLDVAPSFAHHSGWSLDTAVRNMADERFALARTRRRLAAQLRQRLSSWSGHVRSWLDGAPFPLHLVRYEDLKAHTQATFAGLLRFAGIPIEEARLAKAVAFSDFAVLQRMEAEHGFEERSPRAEAFFRRGESGAWRESLSADLVRAVVERHGPVMERLGYETDLGKLLAGRTEPGPMERAS